MTMKGGSAVTTRGGSVVTTRGGSAATTRGWVEVVMVRTCVMVSEECRIALLCLYAVSTASNIMVLRFVYT